MRIGELASQTGVSVRSLRYYEEQGLLASTRSPSGQRHYTEDGVERVRFLQRLYTAGLSSRTIAELLPCVDSPSEENSDAALERMAEERDRLSEYIAELVRTRDALDGLMTRARAHRESLLTGAASESGWTAMASECLRTDAASDETEAAGHETEVARHETVVAGDEAGVARRETVAAG